jgi:hypothetical protein
MSVFQMLRQRLGGVLNGTPAPYLSPQEQQAADQQRRVAMLATMLQGAGPRPQGTGSTVSDLGNALAVGQQVQGQFADQAMRARLLQVQMARAQQGGDPSADIQGYQLAKSQGYAGTYADWLREFKGREANVPAAVQIAKYYEGLDPEARKRFIESNRNIPIETINQVPTRVLPGGEQQPLSSLGQEASAAATVAGAQQGAKTAAERDVKTSYEAPQTIQNLDNKIDRDKQVLAELKLGKYQTGPILGRTPAMTTNQQLFDVFSGEGVLNAISQATFGALSEGERQFLRTTVPSRDKTEEANMAIIERRIQILEKAKKIEQDRLSKSTGGASGGWDAGQQNTPQQTGSTAVHWSDLK